MKIFTAILAVVWVLASVAPAAPQPTAETKTDGEYQLVLYNALLNNETPQPLRPNLVLELQCEAGVWRTVTGMSLDYNQGDHFGIVESAAADGQALRLKITMTVGSDQWVPGGAGVYEVQLKRLEGDRFEGSYTGTFRDQKVEGRAVGEVRPLRDVTLAGYKPLDPTEHPRILFRKHQLPALREKLKTPLGQAWLEQAKASGDIVNLGMLYQLTGEKAYADRAYDAVDALKGNYDPGAGGAGTGGVGHNFVAVVLTYDLCHDAWPAEFREQVATRLMRYITVFQKVLPIAHANYHPCSNYYGPGRGSIALGTMALYGDKGPEPVKPTSPDELLKKGGFEALMLQQSGEIDSLRKRYEKELAQWKAEHQAWTESGGGDRAKLLAFHAGRMHMLRHYRLGVGDGGFQAETGGYANTATYYPLVYANAYYHMFGRHPSPYPDIRLLVVRKMMQQLFLPGGGVRYQKMSTASDLPLTWIAPAFDMAPDEYKPSLLWAWNHLAGVTDEASTANVIKALEKQRGLAAAHAFIHYPLDMKPVPPAEAMPLTWQAPTFGFYLFRSGWTGGNDFIAQVFLKAQTVGGWNHPDAGTLRLMGLGHKWVTGSDDRNGVREQESVVLMPDDRVRNDCARLTHLQVGKDGSGSLTMDMNDLYGGRRKIDVPRPEKTRVVRGGGEIVTGGDEVTRELPLRDGHGFRAAENWADSGVSGLRAVAVDYSGASGAPCLMAVVDRISGGGPKVWTWQVPGAEGRNSEAPKVAVEGNTFTIRYSDAFLKGTVVSPAGAQLEHKAERIEIGEARHGFHGDVNRILVRGADPKAGDFLIVLTVQRKDAPAVTAEGKGLDATVKVGRQTLRFDGQKIIVGG